MILLAIGMLLIAPTTPGSPGGLQGEAGASSLLPSSDQPVQASNTPPNIVLIVTDDQPVGYERYMPRTSQIFGTSGVSYTNAHSLTSTCCPSRATLLTGYGSPKTGVWTNWAPYGGWEAFVANGWENRSLALALDKRGYRTALIGKYLNGYDIPETRKQIKGNANWIPPGWDYWYAIQKKGDTPDGRYYDYGVIQRSEGMRTPKILNFGKDPSHYSTDVFGKQAVNTILNTPSKTPLFMMWTPSAPHKPFVAPPTIKGTVSPTPVAPSTLNQMSGKPPWISSRPGVTSNASVSLQRQQIRTLLGVDHWVGQISDALKKTNRWDNTIFIYVSDNGFFTGQYGLLEMKNHPHTASTNVPLHVVAPSLRGQAGSKDNRLVTLADIPTTIAAAAGLDVSSMDGLPLDRPIATWREGALVTGWRNRGTDPAGNQPSYCAWRSTRWLFIQYAAERDGQGYRELYDLLKDPGAVTNLAGRPEVAEAESALSDQTQAACNPLPPDFTWPTQVIIPLQSRR